MRDDYIIDRITASDLFDILVRQDEQWRVLWLQGGEKMGKSHLLSRFRRQSKKQATFVAHIRLEGNIRNVSDVLREIERQIGSDRFAGYSAAVQKQAAAALVEVKETEIKEANLMISAKPDPEQVKLRRQVETTALCNDLRQLAAATSQPITILFDALDQAAPTIQRWLQDEFLGRLCQIERLCVVVACRNAPEPNVDWEDEHYHHVLQSVSLEDFHDYCQHKKVSLPEQTIKDVHRGFAGVPGMFVNFVETFVSSQQRGQA